MSNNKVKKHSPEWNKKISDGVKRQHSEGRGRSPGFTKEQREKAYKINWRGENLTRAGLHQWVSYWKGRPKKCEHCGCITNKKYEWANKNHKYKRDLNDYIRLCTSCHRKYDIKHNNYSNKGFIHQKINV
jgi:hypothetical protein